MEKIACVVILFNPELKTSEYIFSYLPYVEKLYVIDNSKSKSEVGASLTKAGKIAYYHDSENGGIAKRLNQACKQAIADGFEWLLTMDQDSFFSEKDILAYINCLENLVDKQQTAMTGVRFIGKKENDTKCDYKEMNGLITSGSIVNLNLFGRIGAFDEALFIDQVDYEYCFRAILKGFKIIQFQNIFFSHYLGESSVHVSLKNFKKSNRSLHSPIRIYYMTRNYFYVKKLYNRDFEEDIFIMKKDLLHRLKNNLLYNKKRVLVLKLFITGFIDFKRNKMGKIS